MEDLISQAIHIGLANTHLRSITRLRNTKEDYYAQAATVRGQDGSGSGRSNHFCVHERSCYLVRVLLLVWVAVVRSP